MTIQEILNNVVAAHNLAAQVTVSGNNAILMGDALRMLRGLVAELNGMLGADTDAKGAASDIVEAAQKAAVEHVMQSYGDQQCQR